MYAADQGWTRAPGFAFGIGTHLTVFGMTFTLDAAPGLAGGDVSVVRPMLALASVPFALVAGLTASGCALGLRNMGLIALAPAVIAPIAMVLTLNATADAALAGFDRLGEAISIVMDGRGFFLSEWLIAEMGWYLLPLAPLLVLTSVIDVVLIPFIVTTDVRVLAASGVIIVRSAMALGAAVGACVMFTLPLWLYAAFVKKG